MNQERVLTFGKYKGQDIKYIILTHIGYIMWCFENIDWFKLTDEEQALYDAIAIMIKRERLPMTFPVIDMFPVYAMCIYRQFSMYISHQHDAAGKAEGEPQQVYNRV